MDLRTLVSDPEAFFTVRQEGTSLVGPTAVVAGHALLALAVTAVVLQAVGDVVTPADAGAIVYASGERRISAPRQVVLSLWATGALYFVGWIAVAVVAYLVSLYFDGNGSFRRLLAFVGWAFVPTLVPTAVRTFAVAAMFLDAPEFATEAALQEWARSELADHPARLAAIAVRPLFTLWTVSLWVLAAEYARELTRRQALAAVALPAALATLNAVGTLATAAGRVLGLL
ncbi:YIP1 family protein [Halosimplex litoreum]|uniref:YIP1 family protein n=1 Tax=Halosimplex litoreum TaxID=1198301 RepID=A0A7T3KUN7_9EURY|nr:YIP1 family protein [Halosimplex litoreum]QPV62474.1 YIP1 family protein [Halosimplex litoreum]